MFAGIKDFLFGGRNGGGGLFGGDKESKSVARSRLHFVLVQDRTGLSPDDMANFKREMVQVLERYFVIDEQGFDISYKRESELTTLVINSPVIVRRQDAIGGKVGAKGHAKSMAKNRNGSKSGDSASDQSSQPGPAVSNS